MHGLIEQSGSLSFIINNSFLVVLVKQVLQRVLIFLSEHVLVISVVLNGCCIPFSTVRIDDVLHHSLVIAVVGVTLPEVVLDGKRQFRGAMLATSYRGLIGLIPSSIFEDLALKEGCAGFHMVLVWRVKNVSSSDQELRNFPVVLSR